ncbi:hypothetical protein DN540_37995, partial [Burkholderia multivorans]
METEDLPQITPTVINKGPKIVSFGGGHGLYAALRAFRLLTESLTAVVTVADDGGSSGRLRAETANAALPLPIVKMRAWETVVTGSLSNDVLSAIISG